MEYPGSKFTRTWRRIFQAFFIAIFFISSPAIILYTSGYRYDWQHGLLRKTGSLSIDVLPENANVYLEGLKLKNEMPIRLKNITPRKYRLTISASKYFDWEKEIEVKENETTYIKEISLLKKNEPEMISENYPEVTSLSPNGAFLLYFVRKINSGDGNIPFYDIYLRDNKAGKENLIFSKNFSKAPFVNWSQNSEYFSITNGEGPYNEIFIYAVDSNYEWLLKNRNNEPITKYTWQQTMEPEIFFSTSNSLWVARAASKKSFNIGDNNFIDWLPENGQIWAIEYNSSTQKYFITKDALGFSFTFSNISLTDSSIGTKTPQLKILKAQRDQVLLQLLPGNFLMSERNIQHSILADEWFLSDYGQWWLFWTPWELTAYAKDQSPSLLIRTGNRIENIIPFDRHNTLAVISENRIDALFPYYSVNQLFLNAKPKEIQIDNVNKIMYLAGELKNKQGLWKITY